MVTAYAISLLALSALDDLWHGWVSKDLYRREMGDLRAASRRALLAAGLFYLAYPLAHCDLRTPCRRRWR